MITIKTSTGQSSLIRPENSQPQLNQHSSILKSLIISHSTTFSSSPLSFFLLLIFPHCLLTSFLIFVWWDCVASFSHPSNTNLSLSQSSIILSSVLSSKSLLYCYHCLPKLWLFLLFSWFHLLVWFPFVFRPFWFLVVINHRSNNSFKYKGSSKDVERMLEVQNDRRELVPVKKEGDENLVLAGSE